VDSDDDFEVIVDDVIPTENSGEAMRIMFEVLDAMLDRGIKPTTHAITSRGWIRRFAATACRGVKR